ncbi:MAG: hypothetical protein L6R40_004008 [Gallowayella cf. fulva]|nr:MAG: hypothetical protein L6R40_004008 [Xanthomendoza cf. fulva]
MPGSLVSNLPSSNPQFWAGQDLTLGIMARVGDQTFSLLGLPTPPSGVRPAVVNNAQYTSTHTIFTLSAGNATIKLDFLSPVSPSDYIRQSLPFSYLTISASNAGGAAVQIYADIDESWTGQSGSTAVKASVSGVTSVFQLSVDGATTYTQNAMDQALWGEAVFASRASNSSTLAIQSGSAASVRGLFASNGTLSGSSPTYGAGDVVAIAQDLGSVSSSTSVTYAIGYTRDEAINYLGNARASYYSAIYKDPVSAVSHFLDDYSDAASEASALDSNVVSKATSAAGTNYSDIVTLSVRQAFGGADLTIPADTLDTKDLMLFLKEISSDGNVNTVDVIYPTFPIFYVMAPEYIRLVLEPVVRYLEAGRWPSVSPQSPLDPIFFPWTIHDIGSSYPNATGHDDGKAEQQPIEETGNILILAYAYTKAVNSSSWADAYRSLFQGYADYLVGNGFNIASQLSTDDGAGPLANQTNLAIKAAVGLSAFGAMFNLQNYTEIGRSYANELYTNGLATDAEKTHFQLQYPGSLNSGNTYSTVFNLYPDSLLGLGTFPQEAFEMQANFYPTVRAEAGVPLDSRVPWSKTDWQLFAASSSGPNPISNSSLTATRELLVDDIHAYISNGINTAPFSDRYVPFFFCGPHPLLRQLHARFLRLFSSGAERI